MSKNNYSAGRAWLAMAALALAAAVTPAAAQTRAQMQIADRKLVETHTATYRVTQGEREIGSEAVTVRTYNTNTVVYEGRITMQLSDEIGYDETSRLEVEEDSYFPRAFATTREMWHGEARFTHSVSIEMFGNLAVADTRLRDKTEQRRIVVPAGTAIVATGVLHLFEQLLAVYNEETGGRQSFQVLDALTSRTEQVVVRRVGPEEASVAGETVAATMYTVDREKFSVQIFVDAGGRVVRGEMTMMVYELVSWESHAGEGE
ncbi:MAG: hypothetical protein OEO21_00625 [Candidatus Krumholzibacteria bacterium]|nr:hypothetical protein [Candidatus Krumholzibacteria bacterium]